MPTVGREKWKGNEGYLLFEVQVKMMEESRLKVRSIRKKEKSARRWKRDGKASTRK
jgi:hypothetical protein